MTLPTPDTARVVALASELRCALVAHVDADGWRTAGEQVLVELADELGTAGMEADDGRKAAIMLLNCDCITDWQQRQWRERSQLRNRPDAA